MCSCAASPQLLLTRLYEYSLYSTTCTYAAGTPGPQLLLLLHGFTNTHSTASPQPLLLLLLHNFTTSHSTASPRVVLWITSRLHLCRQYHRPALQGTARIARFFPLGFAV
jgi:hypothetical protein